MKIDGKTKLLGIIGNPLSHSASPAMHNAAIKHLGLNYCYIPFEIEEKNLDRFFTFMKITNILGINVTVPFKEKVIPYLDKLDISAKNAKAVNTIVNKDNQLIGYNTDGEGFIYDLTKKNKVNLAKKSVCLIGAGGAAKAIAYSLSLGPISKLIVINRTKKRAQDLIKQLPKTKKIEFLAMSLDENHINTILAGSDLIINTTTLGMEPNTKECPLKDFSWVKKNQVFYDIVYKPAKTKFLAQAEKKGAKTCFGKGMLVGQGVIAFKLFTGKAAPYEIMKNSF
jgi:shikimate dehydrogenase